MSKIKNSLHSEDAAAYHVPTATEDEIIARALTIVEQRLKSKRANDAPLESPSAAQAFCRLLYAREEREVFAVLFLDTRHRLIKHEVIFRGTIDQAAIYPREIVKAVLAYNAAAVILTHNHPSGIPEPSTADTAITRRIVDALNTINVRVLDHLVVGESECASFAALGLI